VFDLSVFERSPVVAGLAGRSRIGRSAALGRLVLVALPWLWAVSYFFPPLNHDVGALLYFAQRMLHGERLYVDLIDINPPMSFLLDLIPVFIAETLRLPVAECFVAFVLALCAATYAVSLALLARQAPTSRPLGRLLWPALIGFALVVYPAHSFGQREHLLLIFTLPYALSAAARASGHGLPRGFEIALALYALIGIMLKPYYVLVPLLLELLVLACVGMRGWARSAQPWLILGGCIIYVAAVWALLPAYLEVIVPLAARCYENLEPAALLDLLTRDQVPALLLPLIPLALLAFRSPGARLPQAMVCLVLASTFVGILQGKGWDYHFLTARAALVLLFGAVIADGFDRAELGPRVLKAVPPIAVAATVLAIVFALSGVLNPPFKGPRNFANTAASRLLPVVEANAANRPVLWLTSSIYPQFPVLNYTGSTLAMPFMSLWILPAVYAHDSAPDHVMAYHAVPTMSGPERMVYRDVVNGFVRQHPALLLVEQASREGGFHGLPFDYLDYFSRDPAFAAELANYQLLTKIDSVSIYRRH
jgi:hypothetical protein